jgi:hypothetical protein
VLTLGDELALVGFPGDAFDELGLNIKLNSPFPFTIVNEQSGNGTLSYVPNRKAFPEGAYEVIARVLRPVEEKYLLMLRFAFSSICIHISQIRLNSYTEFFIVEVIISGACPKIVLYIYKRVSDLLLHQDYI